MAVVTFLSDYGLADDFVGVCHGVIARIAPDARVIDITHGIARHEVRSGALVLRRSLPYLPPGVHLAVVDPGVGSERRAIAVRCACDEQRVLVGPDNGLLTLAAAHFGGVAEAVDVSRSPYALARLSATFHGRDLFAPVAAHLAAGRALADAGVPIGAAELVALDIPRPRAEPGALHAHVLNADTFGNVMLDATRADLEASGLADDATVRVNGVRAAYATTFTDVAPGALLLYEDSYGALALAVNRGSAMDALGLEVYGRAQIAAEG